MAHNILLTGSSGYLGGDLLASLSSSGALPAYNKLYALVRTETQADAVRNYGAEPLTLDVKDEAAVKEAVLSKNLTVVFFLIDSATAESQVYFLNALGELKKKTGAEVHFLHTSGAKLFSSHAGAPTDRKVRDDEEGLYDLQKLQKPPPQLKPFEFALLANNTVIEIAEVNDVRSYIFIPCIVYGKSRGFGNPISIQTAAIVQAAKAAGRVYRTETGRPTWPVCHISDNSSLYVQILRAILEGKNPGYGKNGYYLASSGSIAWDDIYNQFAKSLSKRGVVSDDKVETADDAALEAMGKGLGCPKEFVPVQLGGKCTLVSENGKKLGWAATYPPEHILDAVDDDTELIIQHMKASVL